MNRRAFTPTTTRKPSAQLDARARRLLERLPSNDARAALASHFSGLRLAPATVRSYASISDRCIDLLAARGDVPAEEVVSARAEVRAIIAQAPLPGCPRTSAAKVCLAPAWMIEATLRRLEEKAAATPDLMAELTWRWACVLWALACRPSEALDMRLAPGDLLVVPNRKEDDERSDGPYRVLRLDACDHETREHVDRLIGIVAEIRATGCECADRLGSMAERLAQASTSAGFPRLCPYTLRHSAIARWREEGVDEEEIRRRLGHAGDAARRHYRKAKNGLRIGGRNVDVAAGDAHDLARACASLGITITDGCDAAEAAIEATDDDRNAEEVGGGAARRLPKRPRRCSQPAPSASPDDFAGDPGRAASVPAFTVGARRLPLPATSRPAGPAADARAAGRRGAKPGSHARRAEDEGPPSLPDVASLRNRGEETSELAQRRAVERASATHHRLEPRRQAPPLAPARPPIWAPDGAEQPAGPATMTGAGIPAGEGRDHRASSAKPPSSSKQLDRRCMPPTDDVGGVFGAGPDEIIEMFPEPVVQRAEPSHPIGGFSASQWLARLGVEADRSGRRDRPCRTARSGERDRASGDERYRDDEPPERHHNEHRRRERHGGADGVGTCKSPSAKPNAEASRFRRRKYPAGVAARHRRSPLPP